MEYRMRKGSTVELSHDVETERLRSAIVHGEKLIRRKRKLATYTLSLWVPRYGVCIS